MLTHGWHWHQFLKGLLACPLAKGEEKRILAHLAAMCENEKLGNKSSLYECFIIVFNYVQYIT